MKGTILIFRFAQNKDENTYCKLYNYLPFGKIFAPFKTLTLEEYAEILGRCLAVLPPEMEIHRLTGDGAKKDLIAPLWSADKKIVMNYINSYIARLPERE